MNHLSFDVVVLGAGGAGLGAALAARAEGATVADVERLERAGGILNQCIHDGFGLHRYKEALTGPEFAARLGVESKLGDDPGLTLLTPVGAPGPAPPLLPRRSKSKIRRLR